MARRRTDLSGVAVVVPLGADGAAGTPPEPWSALGHELVRAGAAVVVVGPDARALGDLAGALEAAGGRVALHVGDPGAPETRAAIVEQLAELFPLAGSETPLAGSESPLAGSE